MKFIAKAKGYFGDRVILPGQEFEAPDDFPASWAVKSGEYSPEVEEDEEVLAKKAIEGLQGSKDPKPAKKKTAKKTAKK